MYNVCYLYHLITHSIMSSIINSSSSNLLIVKKVQLKMRSIEHITKRNIR